MDFSDLLSEAEKLTHDIEGPTDQLKIDRSLRQVLEASADLYTRVAQSGSKDIQANLLLGSKGIDLPRISQKLDIISSKRTLEAIEPVDELDLEACLENELRNCILGAIENEHKLCYKQVAEQTWEHEWAQWKQEKRKIMNAMIGPSGNFIQLSTPESLIMDNAVVASQFMSHQEAVYAAKIIELNQKQAKGETRPNLIDFFAGLAEEFKDAKVNDMWDIMRFMTRISLTSHSGDAISARKSNNAIMDMVTQAKHYLESRYKTYMTNIITDNLEMAQRGGIPGTFSLVRSFLGVRLQGGYIGFLDGTVADRPLWPMVYYCLRSGDVAAAIECLNNANGRQRFPHIVDLLEAILKNAKHPDLAKLESDVRFHYRRLVRNDTDPFKRIVFAVMGCCDISDEHSEVARTADDWLWLKLSLVRVDYDKEDHINYFDFQRTVLEEYGETHYNAAQQPHLYFQVLALTGQFESAIEFLSRIERYKVHAVHMAIALNDLYLLAAPEDYSSPLLIIDPADPKPCRRLNLVRLILVYVQRFEIHCVLEACNYFYLLHQMYDSEKKNMFQVCLCDLVMETREFQKVFGSVQPNGIRTKGILDQFRHPEITVEKTAQLLGQQLILKGMYEDAVDIFDIANNQTEVLKLLSSLLSQVITQPAAQGSLRDRLTQKVRSINERYSNVGFRCSASAANAFSNLKDLLTFFDLYHNKNYSAAIKCLSDMKIIPTQAFEVDDRVSSFKSLTSDVCKVIPDVLLATMNIYFAQYQKIKENEHLPSRLQDYSIDKQLVIIREQARVLTNFTGMLPYRMPGDTNSRLVQMEILMN